jgi:hypothetical protein
VSGACNFSLGPSAEGGWRSRYQYLAASVWRLVKDYFNLTFECKVLIYDDELYFLWVRSCRMVPAKSNRLSIYWYGVQASAGGYHVYFKSQAERLITSLAVTIKPSALPYHFLHRRTLRIGDAVASCGANQSRILHFSSSWVNRSSTRSVIHPLRTLSFGLA